MGGLPTFGGATGGKSLVNTVFGCSFCSLPCSTDDAVLEASGVVLLTSTLLSADSAAATSTPPRVLISSAFKDDVELAN